MTTKPKMMSLDIETFSATDLSAAGVYRYVEDPQFEILLLGYAFDDEPVKVVDLTGMSLERMPDLMDALTDPEITKCAWNANFERTCLARYTGRAMPPEQWEDTMITAAEMGLPLSLAAAGAALGLPEDKQKMQEGRKLIQQFSKPCRPSKANGMRTRVLPCDAPGRWHLYKEYNLRDVETERAIRKALAGYPVADSERMLWSIDQRINDRGVMLDRAFAEHAAETDRQIKTDLKEEAARISGLENPNSVAQIKRWIRERSGIDVKSLDKRVIGDVMDQLQGYPEIIRFLQIRRALAKTSTAKYARMLECVNDDDRIRGLSQFYGASRTGRWSGRNVQLQNLAKNNMPDEDLDLARQLVKSGDGESFSLLFDPAQALSELIRTSLIPKPGCRFVVSDFSAIEARVLAWLAGEQWRLDVFKGSGKIYEASAEQMFHLPPGSVKKGDPMRQKGKIAELALGYGGSVGALTTMGALDMGLTENELKPLVDSWRAANRRITALWWDVDKIVRATIRRRKGQRLNNIAARMDGDFLRIRLPSGREISYANARIENDAIVYDGQIQAGGWGRIETYGPKLVENIIQATSRDCLGVSMFKLDAAGIPVVFHVHDEVICEVPYEGPGSKADAEYVAGLMSMPIGWAPGLPLKADAYECDYYRKD